MTTDYCKYHPLTTATWHCPSCYTRLCDDCTQMTGDIDPVPYCLLCNQPVVSLNQQTIAEPYWLHYTDFMRLAFHPVGIALLLLTMLLPIFAPEGTLLAVSGLSYFVLALYGWGVLQHTATGNLQFPALSNITKSFTTLALQMSLATTVIFVGLGLFSLKLGGFGLILGVLLLLLAPMALMAVAIDKSFASLWLLPSWKAIYQALGLFYWPLVMMTLVVFVVAYAIIHLMADVLPMSLLQGLKHGFYGYALWGTMALTGYALFQFHKPLHFELVGDKKTKKRMVMRKLDYQAARLEVYLKEGLYERATALLKVLAEKEKKNPEIQERYYNLLVFMQDKEQIPYQATNYLEALLETTQGAKALEVLIKLQFLMPDFRPQTPDMCLDLAKACSEQQDYSRAVSLLRDMHKDSPHYANLPDAYFMLARLLNEKLNDTAEALEVLEYLVLRFKKHPRFSLIQRYWQQLGGKLKDDFMS